VIGWGSQAPFAPGLGTVTEVMHAEAPWVGRAGNGVAFGWTLVSGLVSLEFTNEAHGGSHWASYTGAYGPSQDLSAGGQLRQHAVLVATPGDLATVARRVARARGETLLETPLAVTGGGPEQPFVT